MTVTRIGHQISRFYVSLRSETHAARRSNAAPENQFGHRTLFIGFVPGPWISLAEEPAGQKKRIEEFRSKSPEKLKLYFLANLIVTKSAGS
jgi:hypothetical protein